MEIVVGNDTAFFEDVLRNELLKRQRQNKSYSLRAFARFLDLNSAELSMILRSQRGMTKEKAERVCDRLELSPIDRESFFQSIKNRKKKNDDNSDNSLATYKERNSIKLDESYFEIISEWEHFAILSLMDNKDFASDLNWISNRLNLTISRLNRCIKNLENCGLIINKNGHLSKSYTDYKTTEDVISPALRKSHKEALELAGEKLISIPTESRDYSSRTLSIKVTDLPKAKELIREFRNKFAEMIDSQEGEEVYQLNLQFMPLTNLGFGNKKSIDKNSHKEKK